MKNLLLIAAAIAAYFYFSKSSPAPLAATSTSAAPLTAIPSDAVLIWGPHSNPNNGHIISYYNSPTQGIIKYNGTTNVATPTTATVAQANINAINAANQSQ